MPGYFLDTSALAKVYRTEAGSDFIDRIISERTVQPLISRLTILEMASVFALKARIGENDEHAVQAARRRLESDLGRRRFSVAAILDGHFREARKHLFRHGPAEGLRTLDALQLSVALDYRSAGLVTVFVAADQRLCRVAALEGFTVTNPEQPASITI